MDLYDIPLESIDGRATTLAEFAGTALLIANVASLCKLAPQYAGLQALHERFASRGFSVLGFPCNQFLDKEPGTHAEIRSFATQTFGITFPLFSKINVNHPGRHPLFEPLVALADPDGEAGDVEWNFEKFLVSPDGAPAGRFRSMTPPDDPALIAVVEGLLAR
ncbi:MAG TPA: glutathione peroxidase [Actinomycetota bacterium]